MVENLLKSVPFQTVPYSSQVFEWDTVPARRSSENDFPYGIELNPPLFKISDVSEM